MRITVLPFVLLFFVSSPISAQETASTEVNNETNSNTASNSFKNQPSLAGKLFLPQNGAEWTLNALGVMVFTTVLLAEQNVTILSWHEDAWNSRNGHLFSKYDKVEHLGVTVVSQSLLIGLNHSGLIRSTAFSRIKLSLLAITWWELKDSVADFRHYGEWGGEGFSTKDWLASAGGVITTELLNLALVKIF